jgi:hypothetical protein
MNKEEQSLHRRRLLITLQALIITFMVMLLCIRLINYWGSLIPITQDSFHHKTRR